MNKYYKDVMSTEYQIGTANAGIANASKKSAEANKHDGAVANHRQVQDRIKW